MKRTDTVNYEIRKIEEQDIVNNKTILNDLLDNVLKINYPNLSGSRDIAMSYYIDMIKYNKDKSAILIGGFSNKQIVGFIWAYKRKVHNEHKLHINHFVVGDKYRGQGIGAALVKSLLENSDDIGCNTIELMTSSNNEQAIKFYESHGFITTHIKMERTC